MQQENPSRTGELTAIMRAIHQPPGAVHTWPVTTGDALTANRRFRGIADMAGPASLPGPVAIDTREPQDGTVACPSPSSAQLFL